MRNDSGFVMWVILGLIALGLAAVAGAMVAYFIFLHVDLTALLVNQPVQITIAEPLEATARPLDPLIAAIDQTIHARIPVDQMVSMPLNTSLNVVAHFDGEIPVDAVVHVKDSIPIDQVIAIDTVAEAELLGTTLHAPVKGKIHARALVPIDLMVPLKQKIKTKFDTPAIADINQTLNVPFRATIESDIPLKADLPIPVKSSFRAIVKIPANPPLNAVINYADLVLPLRTLQFLFGKTAGQ